MIQVFVHAVTSLKILRREVFVDGCMTDKPSTSPGMVVGVEKESLDSPFHRFISIRLRTLHKVTYVILRW